jgi:hypothetical protein
MINGSLKTMKLKLLLLWFVAMFRREPKPFVICESRDEQPFFTDEMPDSEL